jgi:hypothetical protein
MNNVAAAYWKATSVWLKRVIDQGAERWGQAITDIDAGRYPFERFMKDNLDFWTDVFEWTMIPSELGGLPRAMVYVPARNGIWHSNPVPARDPGTGPANFAVDLLAFAHLATNTAFPAPPPPRVTFRYGTNSVAIDVDVRGLNPAQLPSGHWFGLLAQRLGAPPTVEPIAIVHMVVA